MLVIIWSLPLQVLRSRFSLWVKSCDPTSVMRGSTIARAISKRSAGIVKQLVYRTCCSCSKPVTQCQVRSAPSQPFSTGWLYNIRTSEQCYHRAITVISIYIQLSRATPIPFYTETLDVPNEFPRHRGLLYSERKMCWQACSSCIFAARFLVLFEHAANATWVNHQIQGEGRNRSHTIFFVKDATFFPCTDSFYDFSGIGYRWRHARLT